MIIIIPINNSDDQETQQNQKPKNRDLRNSMTLETDNIINLTNRYLIYFIYTYSFLGETHNK